MGRLIGVGGALVVVAVIGLFLGFGAYFVEDSEAPNAAAPAEPLSATPLSVTIDPACLWPVLDTSFSPDAPPAPSQIPLQDCAPDDAETEVDGDWIRVLLQKGDPGDRDFERRFSGVRMAQASEDGRFALEAYDNWGGSGVFSSLIVGTLTAQGAELSDIQVHAFGDRCNGGLAGTRLAPDGRLSANANMTPWDILIVPLADLAFEAQWEAAKQRFGAAFGKAPSCAICCSAVTHEYEVTADGALSSLGFRYNGAGEASSDDPLTLCLEQSVQKAAGDDGLVRSGEREALNRLIDACARNSRN
ncbi:MAG: hypothetical protein HEP70_09160 [Rhodobiaceae bacterium]|nr:hypothetical protein [Rhodobiaceae bacterium]